MKKVHLLLSVILLSIILTSCKSGAVNLFKKGSPHEEYQRKLIATGLDKTSLGASWFDAASQSILKAIQINIPYKESGYFAAERIPATAYSFEVVRGQKINVKLTKSSVKSKPMMIFLDIWQRESDGKLKIIGSLDTLSNSLQFDADDEENYVIRLQPELLKSGSYTLEITSGPSLGFPVSSTNKPNLGSFYGDGRDAGSRKHEGIDIFAKFHTPVLAITSGVVIRVNENNLGGRVVWMRPNNKNYSLYYAHLDQQIAVEGQEVNPGDTLGLMGNTGNAKTTPPHLHFGIYTSGGAIDPFPFINQRTASAPALASSISNLNETVRTTIKTNLINSFATPSSPSMSLPASTILYINGAFKDYYKVELPDGTTGFVKSKLTTKLNYPLKKIKIVSETQTGYDQPDSLADIKTSFRLGETVTLLGTFSNFLLVSDGSNQSAWISNTGL